MNLGARIAAWSGGEEPYIVFDAKSYIGFKPNWTDGTKSPFRIEVNATLGASGNYFFFDSAMGATYNNSCCITFAISSLTTSNNFKLNGNGSSATYNPTRTIGGFVRGERITMSAGVADNGDGTCSAFYEALGTVAKGPAFDISGIGDNFNYTHSTIGWGMRRDTSYNVGEPLLADVYSMRFYLGENMTDELLPAKDSGGEGCFYNTVSGTFVKRSGGYTGGALTLVGNSRYVET